MPAAVKVRILCSCGWSGEVLIRGVCGSCGADYTHRVTPTRLAKLHAIAGWKEGMPSVGMEPGTAQWLNAGRHKLIRAVEPGQGARTLARGSSYRCYSLTPLGERVLLAAQLVAHEAGLRREIVAESVARHAAGPWGRVK
jgi:hypothetical protein